MDNPFDKDAPLMAKTKDGQKWVTYTLGLGSDKPLTCTAWDIFLGAGEPNDLGDSLLQEFMERFMEKQRDYGDAADDLGAPGQYAEIHRKKAKLKKALWEGEKLVGEPVDEVLMDLIGHCFLALRHVRQTNYGGRFKK